MQKVTRRVLAWYINPIIAQQNTHNFHVLRALQEAERANQQMTERLGTLEREHRDVTARLAALTEAGRGPAATVQDGHRETDRQSLRLIAQDSARLSEVRPKSVRASARRSQNRPAREGRTGSGGSRQLARNVR